VTLPTADAHREQRLRKAMFELIVTRTISAAHAIVIRGVREPLHGHDWRVRVCVRGADLDSEGLLVDFHAVEQALEAAVGRFHNRNLNEIPPFDKVNPTAENVAMHIGGVVTTELKPHVRAGVAVDWVAITEAIGCEAIWRREETR
jgi:6-pyruvoyltetrahydropterin/6-carboxytetrahydropterin synthase